MMGGGTGLAIGIISGGLGSLGQKYSMREALRYTGKTSLVSAGSFMVFMAVGQAIRSGKCF